MLIKVESVTLIEGDRYSVSSASVEIPGLGKVSVKEVLSESTKAMIRTEVIEHVRKLLLASHSSS
jgi:D-aminopeptidase